MLRLARFVTIVGVLAAAALVCASSLINEEAMSTYKRAVEEASKNRPKSTALLRGLLLSSVTIGIDRSSMPDDAYDWEDGVLAGINVWENAIEDSPFRMAKAGEKPDVTIQFTDKIENNNEVQGLIKAQRHFYWQGSQSGARVSGTIFIRTTASRNRYLSRDEISRVLAHELGHLLGLDDDRKGNGIMGDFVPGKGLKEPSREELDSVLDFRKMVRLALDENVRKPRQ
jgi:Zn-dependent protease with chaperone function